MQFIKKTLIITILSSSLFAKTITGIGYGVLEQEAKKEALANLSNNITRNSSFPMLGVSFTKTINEDNSIKYIATLDSKEVSYIYRKRIKDDLEKILYSIRTISNIKDINQRYKLLLDTLEDIDILNEYKALSNILEIKNIPILDISRDEVLSEIQNITPYFSSIDIAIKSLTKNIDKSNIYISSIKQNSVSETTQFSKILKNNMIKELNSTKYSSNADYFLTGEYEVLENSIFIITKLKDINNTTIKTDVIKLDKSAYKDIKYNSSISDFDKTINNQYIKSNNLFVKIGLKGFNRFKKIDLNSDDKINILVNSNKPICYFIVGHSLKNNKKFSYTIGDIRVLETSDINKNILLYEDMPISKPYGVEALQIFASDLKNDGSCSLVYPNCRDNYEGYCVIEGEPSSVISNIRESNLPYKKDNIEKVENSIIFTSFKKRK